MKVVSVGACFLFFVLAGLPVTRASAAPLRVLVYHYNYSETGFSQDASMGGGTVSEDSGNGTAGRSGQMTIDVISATQDGGMVVDITQAVDRQLRPDQTLRCAVYGRTLDVVCDQHLIESPEEKTLLGFLGRFFYDPSKLDAKGHWQSEPSIRPSKATITNDFTVTKTTGDLLQIEILSSFKDGGVESTGTGTMAYDSAMEVPRSVHLDTRSNGSGTYADFIVDLALVSDSMAPGNGQNSH